MNRNAKVTHNFRKEGGKGDILVPIVRCVDNLVPVVRFVDIIKYNLMRFNNFLESQN